MIYGGLCVQQYSLIILSFFTFGCISTYNYTTRAVSADEKCSKANIQKCYESDRISFVRDQDQIKTVDEVRIGPRFDPPLSDVELSESLVFCRYYFHEFSSEGSAKFMCAKTNSSGELFNDYGKIIKNAKSIATNKMNIHSQLNGREVLVDEGVLLDENNMPIVQSYKTESGEIKEKFVEGDLIKVKYFIDQEQTKGLVKRSTIELFTSGKSIKLVDVFVGPSELSNFRWTEIFTEVASTRLFWTLGFPADRTQPLKKLVCFGCNQHPKEQTEYLDQSTSLFQTVSLEKKFKAKKLNDTASIEQMTAAYMTNKWSSKTQSEFEQLILLSRLIGYSNAAESQNRLVCEKDDFDSDSQTCSKPIALIQDLGGSWAWRLEGVFDKVSAYLKYRDKPRGDFNRYSKNKIFKNGCELTFPFGKTDSKSPYQLTRISEGGRVGLLKRLDQLTDEHIISIFETARFGDINPNHRNKQEGSNLDDKRDQIVKLWVNAFKDKIAEIRAARCD